jgi:hypothetical protein
VVGNTGFDHYPSVRAMVAALIEWASTNGFRVDSFGTNHPTGFTWALSLVSRQMVLATQVTPPRGTWGEEEMGKEVDLVEAAVGRLWAAIEPTRQAEDLLMTAELPPTGDEE